MISTRSFGQETLVTDNLGILFKAAEHPVLFVAASAIGILSFYKLWLTATGLREGGYKVSSSAGWGVAITLWVIVLLFGMAIAAIFPGFPVVRAAQAKVAQTSVCDSFEEQSQTEVCATFIRIAAIQSDRAARLSTPATIQRSCRCPRWRQSRPPAPTAARKTA